MLLTAHTYRKSHVASLRNRHRSKPDKIATSIDTRFSVGDSGILCPLRDRGGSPVPRTPYGTYGHAAGLFLTRARRTGSTLTRSAWPVTCPESQRSGPPRRAYAPRLGTAWAGRINPISEIRAHRARYSNYSARSGGHRIGPTGVCCFCLRFSRTVGGASCAHRSTTMMWDYLPPKGESAHRMSQFWRPPGAHWEIGMVETHASGPNP